VPSPDRAAASSRRPPLAARQDTPGERGSRPCGLGGNAVAFRYHPHLTSAAGLKGRSQDWKATFTWDDYREYAPKLTG